MTFQIAETEEIELETNLEAIDGEEKDRFKGLEEKYDAPLYIVFAQILNVLTGKKLITDKETGKLLPFDAEESEFITQTDKTGIKCTHKANEAFLYPLAPYGKCLLSLFKPPIHVPTKEISQFVFSRMGSSNNLRTFELKVMLRNGQDIVFGNVSREDYVPLEMFGRRMGIKTKTEREEGAGDLQRFGLSDDEDDGKRKKVALDYGGEDDDSESEDEDFDPDAPKSSDVAESSSSDEESDSDASDASDEEVCLV